MAQENPTIEKNKVDKVMEYILNTPENTNPAILKSMLEDLSSEGGGGGGSSDFSTAQVTLVGTWDRVISPIGIIDPGPGIAIVLPIAGKHTIVLYKGEQRLFPTTSEGQQISATGNATATFDEEDQEWRIIITGDCTLTITNAS